jgi:hypothetical protein
MICQAEIFDLVLINIVIKYNGAHSPQDRQMGVGERPRAVVTLTPRGDVQYDAARVLTSDLRGFFVTGDSRSVQLSRACPPS